MSWTCAALVLLIGAFACSRKPPTGTEGGDAGLPPRADADAGVRAPLPRAPEVPEWPSPSEAPPPGKACDDMTAPQCLLASRCVLEAVPHANPGYLCREAKGPCEGGIAQFPALKFKVHCESRPDCRYVPGECFCPGAQTRVRSTSTVAINCVCGGGPPHRCVTASAGRQSP